MGDSGIRYAICRERFAPEERQYLTQQYEQEYQFYLNYLRMEISRKAPVNQTSAASSLPSSEPVEIRIDGEGIRRINGPLTGEIRRYTTSS